jgi:probable blue pigment (indigoidine) exporter
MSRTSDLLITALAPLIWGSTYVVTTELLPAGYPVTASALRALPAGLLLLLIVRHLPRGEWWWKSALLGAFNFTIFQTMLFVSAYRLPGGVAATVGAIQPLIVILLARFFMGNPIRLLSIIGGLAGIAGVALLVLTPHARLDMTGIAAGLVGAVSMAFGTVLSRHWQPPVSPLTVTAWQLTAGGILLVPIALAFEPALPPLTLNNWLGFTWLGLVGGAFAYIIWFRGIARLEPAAVSPLGFLSPLMAVILGWGLLSQQLSAPQIAGMAVVLVSVWVSQIAQTRKPAPPALAAAKA